MKICEFCGAKASDDIKQCDSCGSKEFKNICNNCGSTFLGIKCPSCGLILGEKPRVCFNCGKKTFDKSCPDCGADLINRRKVQAAPQFILHPQQKKKSKLPAFIIIVFYVIGVVVVGSVLSSALGSDNSTDIVTNEIADQDLSYVELLTLIDHPKFYGDYHAAKKFWKGYDKVKVVNASLTRYNEDALLLITTGDEDNDVITNVTINLSDIEKKQYLELDNVMQLICDYIPYDIIDEYYDYKESFHETYKYGEYEAYHYVMELNDAGKELNKSGERYLDSKFAFKIIHRNEDDWLAEMKYLSYEGKHDKVGLDYYEVEDWDANIEKYQ